MPTTTPEGAPYPTALDANDVPLHIQQLAEWVSTQKNNLDSDVANLIGSASLTLAALQGAVAADVQLFTASGTWTKPANAKVVHVIAFGAGGGGGAQGSSGSNVGGGGGGAFAFASFPSTRLGATESVTVGAGGAGALPSSGSSVAGNGGSSSFGASYLSAPGGQGGKYDNPGYGGPDLPGKAYTLGSGADRWSGADGSKVGPAGTTNDPKSAYGGGGGGGGGCFMRMVNVSIPSTSVIYPAHPGGIGGYMQAWVFGGGGAAGTAVAAVNGGTKGGDGGYLQGGGGGGGDATTGYEGGAGGVAGGGGTGCFYQTSGNAIDTARSGKGGNGGRGEVIVITFF